MRLLVVPNLPESSPFPNVGGLITTATPPRFYEHKVVVWCAFTANLTAPPGTYNLSAENAFVSGTGGARFTSSTTRPGWITVAPFPGCPGDCDKQDGTTISDLIAMVNILLSGASAGANCAAGDIVRDDMITVDEIVFAINIVLSSGSCETSSYSAALSTGAEPIDDFVTLEAGSAVGGIGQDVMIPVAVSGGAGMLAGAQLDLFFDAAALEVRGQDNLPRCAIDPRLQGTFELSTSYLDGLLRLMVHPPLNVQEPIPTFSDGVVARCTFTVNGSPGSYSLVGENAVATTATGYGLASMPGSGNITVSSPLLSLSGPVSAVGSELQQGGWTAVSDSAVSKSLTVTLSSLTPDLCAVSTSPTAAGGSSRSQSISAGHTTTGNFVIQSVGNGLGTCKLKPTASGYASGEMWLSIVQPGFGIASGIVSNGNVTYIPGLPSGLSLASQNVGLLLNVGLPRADLSDLANTQPIRAGATPLAVTVSLENPQGTPTPAELQYGSPLTSTQSAVVHIEAGQIFQSESLQLRPLSVGETTVNTTTDVPGWITTNSAKGVVHVLAIPTPTPGPCTLDP
ncbi:MAG: hypothetical protein HY270_12275 [Deltaproteobacteria bacterium]|nr:hypothetical protein [Deltaproteobacteria bacterium]